jgi:hypothetical protein
MIYINFCLLSNFTNSKTTPIVNRVGILTGQLSIDQAGGQYPVKTGQYWSLLVNTGHYWSILVD